MIMETGTRIRFTADWGVWPHAFIDAGQTGTVVEWCEDVVRVRMDDDYPGLAEWDNEVHFYCDDDAGADFIAEEVLGPVEVALVVVEPTVPTSGAAFHSSATHVDALGMPVAFYDGSLVVQPVAFHPTPCCGAAATAGDSGFGVYCKACYERVDAAYGNVPVEPIRER